MSKKTRTILLIILLLVVAVIASRSLWQGQGLPEEPPFQVNTGVMLLITVKQIPHSN